MKTADSIGNNLIQQLYDHGVRHVFGVTGDYVLGFYDQLTHSKLEVITTCDEQGAGFAADAYARIQGLGVVCVTYGVGGLKVVNTTAQAYAEKSPVVVISGAPGTKERVKNPLLHHKVRDFDTQLKVFEQITVASTVLNNSLRASSEIHRVLSAALRYKRPVYIELPRDMVTSAIIHHDIQEIPEESDPDALKEALEEAVRMINSAKKPVIIAGEEIQRFGLRDELLQLLTKTNMRVAATILSKSVISEYHPLYLGVYAGGIGNDSVREYVESSDCLIILGALMSDVNLGMFTAQIDQGRAIYITSEELSIRYHKYEDVRIEDFLRGLKDSLPYNEAPMEWRSDIPHPEPPEVFSPVKGRKITVQRLFQCIDSFLNPGVVVTADPGDALFGALDLVIHKGTEFLSPAYYASMGFAVPASIGAQMANPALRPLVLVGDGAFQMTGMELSTAVRYHLNPIVIVLNNRGYGTERVMLDGPFNDVLPWEYSRIPEILGGGMGFLIENEEQLYDALKVAGRYKEAFCILDVRLDTNDRSPALQRITDLMAKLVR